MLKSLIKDTIINKLTNKNPQPKTEEGKIANLSYISNENQREVEAKKLGYELDRGLSNSDHTVLKKDGKVKVVFKGTSKAKDLLADINIVRGNQENDPTFKEALEKTKKVQAKYGNDIEVSGHSLGGSKAIHVGEKLKLKSTALNPGITPFRGKKNYGSNINIKSISGDIVSGNPNIFKNVIDTHGLENF